MSNWVGSSNILKWLCIILVSGKAVAEGESEKDWVESNEQELSESEVDFCGNLNFKEVYEGVKGRNYFEKVDENEMRCLFIVMMEKIEEISREVDTKEKKLSESLSEKVDLISKNISLIERQLYKNLSEKASQIDKLNSTVMSNKEEITLKNIHVARDIENLTLEVQKAFLKMRSDAKEVIIYYENSTSSMAREIIDLESKIDSIHSQCTDFANATALELANSIDSLENKFTLKLQRVYKLFDRARSHKERGSSTEDSRHQPSIQNRSNARWREIDRSLIITIRKMNKEIDDCKSQLDLLETETDMFHEHVSILNSTSEVKFNEIDSKVSTISDRLDELYRSAADLQHVFKLVLDQEIFRAKETEDIILSKMSSDKNQLEHMLRDIQSENDRKHSTFKSYMRNSFQELKNQLEKFTNLNKSNLNDINVSENP